MLTRRQIILLASAASVLDAQAQESYPSKTITFVVPWGVGGSNDIISRSLASILGDQGFNVIVENQPGAMGAIGLQKVANAPADGYMIGLGTSTTLGNIALNKTSLRNQHFDHIARVSLDPFLLVVPAQSKIDTLEQFIDLMKKTTGGVSIGGNGDFNIAHILAAMTARSVGSPFVYAPYPGGSKIIIDLLGGHLQSAVLKPSDCKPQLDSKRLKAIGLYAKKRLLQLSSVPTFAEKGIDVFNLGSVLQMSYVVAPKGLPIYIREKLIQAFRKALNDDRYKSLSNQYAFIVDDLTGEDLMLEVNDVGAAISAVIEKITS